MPAVECNLMQLLTNEAMTLARLMFGMVALRCQRAPDYRSSLSPKDDDADGALWVVVGDPVHLCDALYWHSPGSLVGTRAWHSMPRPQLDPLLVGIDKVGNPEIDYTGDFAAATQVVAAWAEVASADFHCLLLGEDHVEPLLFQYPNSITRLWMRHRVTLEPTDGCG